MAGLVDTAARLLPRQMICRDAGEAAAAVEAVTGGRGLRVVSFLNKDAILIARRDPAFLAALEAADFLFRDGLGLEAIMKRAGMLPGLNMNGTDLIPRLIGATDRATPVALYGTRDPALAAAALKVRAIGFGAVETRDGFAPVESYVAGLAASEAGLVVLGMGMPKQEMVAKAIAESPALAGRDMVVINGGAILDFMGGAVRRAPGWMRRAKLEWVYRTAQEPGRLIRRTASTIPLLIEARLVGGKIADRMTALDHEGRKDD